MAVGNPDTAQVWPLRDVPNVHAWLEEQLAEHDIPMAGVQLRGQFGTVETSISYNIPLTGLDLSGGYKGEDFFRFANYMTSTWTMDGIYGADPALQPVISTAGHPLHLHGYQPETMRGGHIKTAAAISATATIWPLEQILTRTVRLNSVRLIDEISGATDPDDEEGVARVVADHLENWDIKTIPAENGERVIGYLPGSEIKIVVISALPDDLVDTGLALSLARRFNALPPDARPELYILDTPDEDTPISMYGTLDPSVPGADLIVVIDDPDSITTAAAQEEPVVVWDPDNTPGWAVDFIRGYDSLSIEMVEADLTDSDLAVLFIKPALASAQDSNHQTWLLDTEESERLLIDLIKFGRAQ